MQESDSPQDSWQPFVAEAETIRRTYDHPLRALAHGEIPAFVLRGAHPPADCNRLI